MSIEFFLTPAGDETCSAGGKRLHSAYNPVKEGQIFAESAECDFNPAYVIVTGPALSYCAPFLKSRFPDAKICAIHYTDDFSKSDSKWDIVFSYSKYKNSLSDKLYNEIGEEGLSSSLFLSWLPSQKVFEKEYIDVWKHIKEALLKSRDILATREYFSLRWAKNSLKFAFLAKNLLGLKKKGNCPILIAASGPSLESSLPLIKKYRNSFYLLSLSSALGPLLYHGIKPDMVLSTDGGYWAKKHLEILSFYPEFSDIILALSPESACPSSLLEKNAVFPLSYGDGCSESFLYACTDNPFPAKRNGTVSGTGAFLALSISSGPVFFCGLDLAASHSFVHTRPNALESGKEEFDYRLSTKESRLTPSIFSSPSLDIYRNWFENESFSGKIVRLSDNFPYTNKLAMKDVNWDYFLTLTHNGQELKKDLLPCFSPEKNSCGILKEKGNFLKELVEKNRENPAWVKDVLPAQAIALQKSLGSERETEEKEKLSRKMDNFCQKLKNILNLGV